LEKLAVSDDESNSNKKAGVLAEGSESTIASGSVGLKESLALTPVFANITNVTTAGEVTRISFGESYGGVGSRLHTSVAMPTQVALELATLIQQVVGVHLKRMEQEAEVVKQKKSLN
jgi:hypothetical protein